MILLSQGGLIVTEGYVDLSALNGAGEPLVEPLETEDYSTFALTPVGNYVTHSRVITAKEKDDGTTTFAIELVGGVQHPETGKMYNVGKFPLRTWVSDKLYQQNDRPGKTSGVAEYLRACGFNPKQFTTKGELISAVMESQTIPVGVFIGRTNKAEKQADGSYAGGGELKTKSFLNEDGTYATTVVVNGKTYIGKEKVGSFSRL